MKNRVLIVAASLSLAAIASLSFAAESPKADPRVELARKLPGGAKPEDLRPSPIPGIYELTQGANVAYVTADGKYAIAGDLYDIAADVNLSENKRRDVRAKLISSIPESRMLVFSPSAPKYTVTVFTDIDCSFCRKLHGQIAEYNKLGIRVRYLFYPRSGPGSASWEKAEQVWCSKDRNDTFTRLKRGETVQSAKSCKGSPVAEEYALGQKIDIGGTPAILFENGELHSGYLPPAMLAQALRGN